MSKNYPYVGGHYFSENFRPQDLCLTYESLVKSESRLFRNEVEFIFVVSGTGKIEINGSLFPVKAGNLIHLLPYHIHRFVIEKGQALTFYRMRFSLGLLLLSSVNEKNYLSHFKDLDQVVSIMSLPKRKIHLLTALCEEVLYEKQHAHTSFENLHLSLVSFIAYFMQTISGTSQSDPPSTKSWRCLEYIHLHHQDSLTLDTVAKALSLPKETVQAELKEATNFSFSQLLNQVRIRNATALLQFPDLTIQQIGSICGYQSNANFYKQFKEIHKQTPQAYRDQLNSGNQLIAYSDAWDVAIFILENCLSPLTLETLVAQTRFSADKINELLKEKFKMTFKELLNLYRIQIGRILLLNLPLNVTEVALKVGFLDANTFIRNYKKVFQVTPHQEKMLSRE
ncbi:AraC family transcriptional regulator [Jeotgalibaca caeni]|uniref:AraC family transcriptional regulator n=1 Tax=Jeotgalibaca caeni TaxID=3028623 RepID=UPI00237E9BAF|nr:helix-turn-helix domain-containing protein [Jeotgalibaca caeni]MDE1547796.1 helix-turn-helix domain-containing protein [Jeotgalibaca caeni]